MSLLGHGRRVAVSPGRLKVTGSAWTKSHTEQRTIAKKMRNRLVDIFDLSSHCLHESRPNKDAHIPCCFHGCLSYHEAARVTACLFSVGYLVTVVAISFSTGARFPASPGACSTLDFGWRRAPTQLVCGRSTLGLLELTHWVGILPYRTVASVQSDAILSATVWVSDVVQKALIGYVDDDPFVLEAAGFLLIAFGYDVVLFSSAESALSNRGESQIDCLVTDLQLPGLSGLQLYERLRLDGRHVPTIVVTAFADERVRCQAQQAGVSAVLEKPVANDALLRAIESALSSSPSPPK